MNNKTGLWKKKIEVEKSTECGRACLLLSILYPREKKKNSDPEDLTFILKQ